MDTFRDRLLWAMQRAGISTQALANALGASYQAIRKAENGLTKSFSAINNEKAARILKVSARWLATGEGDSLAHDREDDDTSFLPIHFKPILAWEHPEDLPEGEFIFIPLMDIRLSAGHGAEQDIDINFSCDRPLAFRADWIRQMHLSPAKLISMFADGDSMEPRIQHGDALVVDTAQKHIIDGKVYALYYDGGERVKRLFKSPGGGLLIKSDNKDYPDIQVSAGETGFVRIIGRVVHIAGEGGL